MSFFSKAFALMGAYYTICEIEINVWETDFFITIFRKYWFLLVFLFIVITFFISGEPLSYERHIGDKDFSIGLRIADILNIKDSAIVIPTNTTFDTTMKDEFISDKSIQGKFQREKYRNDFSALDQDISNSLDEMYPNQFKILEDRTNSKKKRYEIGTVAKVRKDNQTYYFLAIADVNKYGKPQKVKMNNMVKALVGLWDYISKNANTEPITIPVIGTGRAGLSDGTLEDVVHESIFSFITKSKEEFVSKKMTICIYPPTLEEANVTWERLCGYLDLQCTFIKDNHTVMNIGAEGTPID